MQLSFDNCDIAVNGSGILATNASISSENSVEAAYILGYTRPSNQLPYGSIKSIFNATYLPVISQEPNCAAIGKIKAMINDSGYMGEKFELAGLTNDYCFLTSYNLKIVPNNIAESDVSYTTFWPLCGNLRGKSNNIEYYNQGDISHSWSTFIINSGDYTLSPVYNFAYAFRATWLPVYAIGKTYPVEVKLINAQEIISFDIDNYRNVLFSGEEVYNNLFQGNGGDITFKNFSITCSDGCDTTGNSSNMLSLNISGFKVKNTIVSSQGGEILRVNYQANKYY